MPRVKYCHSSVYTRIGPQLRDRLAKIFFLKAIEECINDLDRNRGFIVDYGDRYRSGEVIASSFVESAVNQVVSKRFCKKQQMSWSPVNADNLLQLRTAVLNERLRDHFERWHPSLAPASEDSNKLAA